MTQVNSQKRNCLLHQLPLLLEWQHVKKRSEELTRSAFVLEFAGMPKAGKSSAIENVRHFFTHGPKILLKKDSGQHVPKVGYRVHTPAEGVSLRTPNYLKRSPSDFNIWAGAYGVQELLQAAHDDHHDLVVLDRGPWDAGCWLEYWASEADAEEDRQNITKVKGLFQLDYWMTRSDLHIVLVVDPAKAIKRERAHRLITHAGASSNPELMQRMREIYEERFSELRRIKEQNCPHVGKAAALLIDTTKRSREDVALEIITATMGVLEAKLKHHTTEFTVTSEFVMGKLAAYLPGTRARVKREFDQCISEFVEQANALTSPERQQLAATLEEWSIPEQKSPLVTLRVTPNTLKNSLDRLLVEVRSQ